MNLKLRMVSSLLALMLASACGGSDFTAGDIKSSAPAGTFGGAPWTLGKAVVRRSGTNLEVSLYSDPSVPDCGSPSPDSTAGFLLWTEPAAVGERQLNFSLSDLENGQTVTFVTPPSSNTIITDGILNVTDLSDTAVTIGLDVKDSTGANAINGTFTAAICP